MILGNTAMRSDSADIIVAMVQFLAGAAPDVDTPARAADAAGIAGVAGAAGAARGAGVGGGFGAGAFVRMAFTELSAPQCRH